MLHRNRSPEVARLAMAITCRTESWENSLCDHAASPVQPCTVAMLRLNRKQRTAVSDTARQVGNLALAAMVFGQFVARQPVSWRVAIAGAAAWLVLVVFGVLVLKGADE
jgi:hypothetical protein